MITERDKILALEKLAAITPLRSGRSGITLTAPKLRGTKPTLQGGRPGMAFQKNQK